MGCETESLVEELGTLDRWWACLSRSCGIATLSASNTYEMVQKHDRDANVPLEVINDIESSERGCDDSLGDANDAKIQHDSKSSTFARWKDFILAWVSVILAIIAGSAIGPAFKFMTQNGIRSCLSASWRCQCMFPFLFPLAIMESYSSKENAVDWFARKPDLQYPVIVHIFFSGLSWSGNLLFWIIGLQYISTFKASLIACSHPLMLTLWLLIRGDKVPLISIVGILVAFAGLLLSNLPDLIAEMNEEKQFSWQEQALGIALCLASAICEVLVFFNRMVTRKYVPLMQYTFSTSLVVTLSATLCAIFLEGTGLLRSPELVDAQGHVIPRTVEIFCIADNCIFGYLTAKWFPMVLLFAFTVGVVSTLGFNYAMQYLPPMVFSSVALLDPALTAVLSWLCGIEALPTMYSWLGGGTVIVGVAIVSVAESQEEEAAAVAAAITAAELEQEAKERIRAYGESHSQSLSHVTNQRGVVDDDSFEDSSCHPLTSHSPHTHPHKGNEGEKLRTVRDHEHTRSYIEEDDANSYCNSLTSSSHATIFNPVLPKPAAVVASNSKRQLNLLPPPSDSDEDIGDVTPFRHNSYAHTRQYRSTQTPLAAKAQLSGYEALDRDSETSAPCDNPSLDAHLELQHGGDDAHEPSAM